MDESMEIVIDKEILEIVPEIFVENQILRDVIVTETTEELQKEKNLIIEKWKGTSKEQLDLNNLIIAYRNLNERLSVTLKGIPHAVEGMLVRGILKGEFPNINSVVDTANIISLNHLIPLGVFDFDKIEGELELTLAKKGDLFIPIGAKGRRPALLGAPILKDSTKIISVIGLRDSVDTMITNSTRNLLILSWGAEGISREKVSAVVEECASLLTK